LKLEADTGHKLAAETDAETYVVADVELIL
jgi:hypothetical protein